MAFSIAAPRFHDSYAQTINPSKQLVRDYLDERTQSDSPPPTPVEILCQLGCDMLPASQRSDCADRD